MRKRLRIVFVVAVILVLLGIAHFADQRSSRVGIVSLPQNPLLGAWIGEQNNLLNFRPDGSVRARNADDKTEQIQYLHWEADSSSLTITYKPRPGLKTLVNQLLGYQFQVKEFSIVEITAEYLVLKNKSSGNELRFKRQADSMLEQAE